ncbi:MAG: phosphoribosyltransferase [Candidatus Aenigmarchaeota archaeon]|nr:phosphoribosyltransferase [Candidatus Aenigmarchaeota archaeon]
MGAHIIDKVGWEGNEQENYEVCSLFATKWPELTWDETKYNLKDPNSLFQDIDSILGIDRKKDYFDCINHGYLIIDFDKKEYFDKLDKYANKLEDSETMDEIYNCLDYLRNSSLHFLSAWNHNTREGGASVIDKIKEYGQLKEISNNICEELYNCVSLEEYKPNTKSIFKQTDKLKDICGLLPEECKSKIRQLDNPIEHLIHAHRINLSAQDYDTAVGILNGGLELPFTLSYVQDKTPEIAYLKYSGYSEGDHNGETKIDEKSSILELFELKEKIENKRIIILDDSISTGRTLNKIVGFLKPLVGDGEIEVSSTEYIGPKKGISQNMINYGRYIDAPIIPSTFKRNIWKSDIIKVLEKFKI